MAKQKKIDREFLITDNSVNCYGYRLLTEGYLIDEFKRNPIGYRMHDRDEGVIVRWEDLRVDGDKVFGKPVINLSNEKGQQTVDEIESLFLNAASVGHIVVLDYSNDPEMMLKGQTGPTITKWYNRECSVVDIPGNTNALASLFDIDGNKLKLSDLMAGTKDTTTNNNNNNMNEITLSLADLAALSKVGVKVTDASGMVAKIVELKAKADQVPLLETALENLKNDAANNEIKRILDKGLADKKLTQKMYDELKAIPATPEALQKLVDATPVQNSIVDLIQSSNSNTADLAAYQNKTWDELMETGKLEDLKANHPEFYKQVYKKEFGVEPKI